MNYEGQITVVIGSNGQGQLESQIIEAFPPAVADASDIEFCYFMMACDAIREIADLRNVPWETAHSEVAYFNTTHKIIERSTDNHGLA